MENTGILIRVRVLPQHTHIALRLQQVAEQIIIGIVQLVSVNTIKQQPDAPIQLPAAALTISGTVLPAAVNHTKLIPSAERAVIRQQSGAV